MKATQCNHRKDVDKCPITLNTKVTIILILMVINIITTQIITADPFGIAHFLISFSSLAAN